MRIGRRLAVLAAVFLVLSCTASTVAEDLPSTTITITKNVVQSGSPHTVSTFQPSVDLGVVAGLSQTILEKYMDSLCGLMSDSSGSQGAAGQFASNIINAITPPAIGTSSYDPSPGLSGPSGSSQPMISLTPEQVANMQQQGSLVIISAPPAAGTQTLTVSAPSAAAPVSGEVNPNTVIVYSGGTASGAGEISLGVHGPDQMSVSQSMHQQGSNQLTDIPYISGFTFTLPLAIVLDTFWAPSPNAVTKAKLKISWDISKAELNEFNRLRAMGTLVPLASVGRVSMSTDSFEFRRECGARTDIGLSAQWKGSLRKLVGVQLTDIAVEINDPSDKNGNVNDPLGAQTLRHSDSLFLSDAAQKIISALSGKSSKAAKDAGNESIGGKILDEIIGEIGVKVQVVQSTLNRKATASFKATGKDFSGKTVALEVVSNPITFDSENHKYPLNIKFPEDCPPLKEITLKATDVAYSFEEHGYPEIVVTGFGQELPTGPLLEKAELFTESSHTMTDWTSSGGDMKIAVNERPVIYPIRGNITVGNPPGGLHGAQVRVFTRSQGGHETDFNNADSNPAGDFIADICTFATGDAQPAIPPYIIEVSKAGYQTITSAGNPENFVKINDSPLTYKINMPLTAGQTLAVSGRILDSSNQGVSGAEVLLSCAGVEYQATSGPAGAYQFPEALFGNTIEVHANKAGLYFNPETRSVTSGSKSVTVDLRSSSDRLWGTAQFNFRAESGGLPASVNVTRSSLGRSISVPIPADGIVRLAVIGSNSETFTFDKDDYTITPGFVSVEFSESDAWSNASSGAPAVPSQEFGITVSSRIPSAVALSADRYVIERFGSFYNPPGDKERAVLTARVVDSAGRPVGGANARFEMTGTAVKILEEGVRPSGARPDCAYAQTDANGDARVTICSMRDLGTANVIAAVYYGDAVANLRSNGYAIAIEESTRPERTGKPVCGITAEAGKLGLSGPGVRIAKGGDILFRLNYSPNSPLGTLDGYRFLYSRDNGPAEEEFFNDTPHPVARKTFNEAGSYITQYMVRRAFDGNDVWSDPAEATFTVAEYAPPRASLTVPHATGTVNLPVDYSFTAEVSAPFKRILITFGDNTQDVDLDAGLLSGKYYWSGTFYHTYASDGTFPIRLKVVDQTDAFKEEARQVTIGTIASLNDHTAPAGSITINNGASSTTERSVVIHAAATDDISGVYRIRYSNDGSNWSNWNTVAIEDRPFMNASVDRVWQLTDGAGTKTVYVQFKDAADNISPAITDTINLQAVGVQASGTLAQPQATVTGYQGAPMPYGSITIISRSGNAISAAFSATNDWAIFVNQMALSFDNQNWSAWMPFEQDKQISLDGHLDATKVYVVFADAAGGQSAVYQAGIPPEPAAQAETSTSAAAVSAQQAGAPDSPAQAHTSQAATEETKPFETAGEATEARDTEKERAEKVLTAAKSGRQTPRQAVASAQGDIRPATAGKRSGPALEEKEKEGEGLKKIGIEPERVAGKTEAADIAIKEIRLPREIFLNERAEVEVSVINESKADAGRLDITLESEDGLREKKSVFLGPRGRERAAFTWTPKKPGRQALKASVEYRDDSNPSNNRLSQTVEVKKKEEAAKHVSAKEIDTLRSKVLRGLEEKREEKRELLR